MSAKNAVSRSVAKGESEKKTLNQSQFGREVGVTQAAVWNWINLRCAHLDGELLPVNDDGTIDRKWAAIIKRKALASQKTVMLDGEQWDSVPYFADIAGISEDTSLHYCHNPCPILDGRKIRSVEIKSLNRLKRGQKKRRYLLHQDAKQIADRLKNGVPEDHTDIHDAAEELGWHVDVVRRKTPKHLRKYYRGWRIDQQGNPKLHARLLAIPNDHLQRLKAQKTESLEHADAELNALRELPDSAVVSPGEAAKLLHRAAGYAQKTMERMLYQHLPREVPGQRGFNPRTNHQAKLVIIADVKRAFGIDQPAAETPAPADKPAVSEVAADSIRGRGRPKYTERDRIIRRIAKDAKGESSLTWNELAERVNADAWIQEHWLPKHEAVTKDVVRSVVNPRKKKAR